MRIPLRRSTSSSPRAQRPVSSKPMKRGSLASVFQFGDRRVNESDDPANRSGLAREGHNDPRLLRVFAKSPHSRFPVYEDSQDDVVGIVGIKDVLRGISDGHLTEDSPIDLAMRPAMFTPETKLGRSLVLRDAARRPSDGRCRR